MQERGARIESTMLMSQSVSDMESVSGMQRVAFPHYW